MTIEFHSSPIRRRSLTNAVADVLRTKITNGEIRAGEQLRQDAIASQFEVSRIPVREALWQLESEGLITMVQHRGAVVSSLSPDDIEELFEIRALLECAVLEVSILRLTEADLANAQDVLGAYEKGLSNEEHISELGRLNRLFHSALYSRANRPHFLSIIKKVNNNAERYTGLQLYLTREFDRAKEEHRQLLELCRARDVAAARDLLERHIRHAGRSLKAALVEGRARAEVGRS
jgi:DNA-binding GntR family transcriptional regulator